MENNNQHQKYYCYSLFGDRSPIDMKKLEINGQKVDWNSTVMYLGITLNSKLNFSNHVTKTCNKARRIRFTLYAMLNQHSPLTYQNENNYPHDVY